MPTLIPPDKRVDGKELRPKQLEVLEYIEKLPKNAKVVGIISPTGSGKSLISRAIQLFDSSPYIVPNNVLVSQFCDQTPATPIYGKTNYTVIEDGESTLKELQDLAAAHAYNKLAKGEGTFAFNPVSWVNHRKSLPRSYTKNIVLDEAHNIVPTLSLLTTATITNHPRIQFPAVLGDISILAWLKAMKKMTWGPGRDRLDNIIQVYETQPEIMSYTVNKEKQQIAFTPVIPPLFLLQKFFPSGRKILLSATLIKPLIPMMVPGVSMDDVHLFEVESDFPIENRRIRYIPVNFRDDGYCPDWYTKVAPKIAEIIASNGHKNTLIHATYSTAEPIRAALAELLPGMQVLTFNKTNKKLILEQWKVEGGVLVASGVAEGVDLYDDLCRINIVAKMPLANVDANFVQKRMGLPGGDEWYYLSAFTQLIQMFGRGVRHKDDHCINIILDPAFPKLLIRWQKYLPKSFLEAIDL